MKQCGLLAIKAGNPNLVSCRNAGNQMFSLAFQPPPPPFVSCIGRRSLLTTHRFPKKHWVSVLRHLIVFIAAVCFTVWLVALGISKPLPNSLG